MSFVYTNDVNLCTKFTSFSIVKRFRGTILFLAIIYLKYKKVVAEILLSESELTDTIIDKIGARKQIDLRDYDEFYLLIDNYKDEHEFEERKIELAIKLRDNNFFNNFPKLIEAEIADNLKLIEQIKINNAKLKEAESIVKNGNC